MTALVTGGAKRIGQAFASALARDGANVIIHFQQSQSEAEGLLDSIRRTGTQAWALQATLDTADEVNALFQRAVDAAGRVDIVVNNASIFPESTLDAFSTDELHRCVDVNAMAPLLLGRALHRCGHGGSVLNLLDCLIADYDKQHAAYHLSKRMLFTLTRMMAVEYAPKVQVNAVAPGLVLPPEGKDDAYLARLAASNPLNRYGHLDDVIEAGMYLLKSEFVTGQVLFVDGGRHMRGSMYG
ncbi:MAG: oxidoreductase [Candidatus Hydrogenedentota bacterium]